MTRDQFIASISPCIDEMASVAFRTVNEGPDGKDQVSALMTIGCSVAGELLAAAVFHWEDSGDFIADALPEMIRQIQERAILKVPAYRAVTSIAVVAKR